MAMSDEREPPGCARCGNEYGLDEPDHEPTEHCHPCAHEAVVELQAEVARLRALLPEAWDAGFLADGDCFADSGPERAAWVTAALSGGKEGGADDE
jgi:hypothetical protein